jgi:hypothetical protein
MSIEHKAWLLDYKAFHDELAGILFRALDTGELAELAAFIDTYHASMTDPWTWEPLPANWRAVLKERGDHWNAQTLGEVALTRYYDVTENVGLSYGFDAVHAYLKSAPALNNRGDALIGGYGFGPRGKRFDPGYMGTGERAAGERERQPTQAKRGKCIPDLYGGQKRFG